MSKQTIFLIRNIAPDKFGGAETYQLTLAAELKKNNYTPVIITASSRLLQEAKKQHIQSIKSPYIKNQDWSGWRNLLLPIYFILQVKLYFWYKKQIGSYHPIMIDIQSRDEWIAATLAGRQAHTKVFWTDHIDFRTWVLQNVDKKFKNTIGKIILRLANIPKAIIMISDYEKAAFDKIVSPRRYNNLVVMKNGVADQKPQYRTQPVPQSFCYIGRIVDYKGIKELIEAFNIVTQQFSQASLHIYGDGPDYHKYKSLANSNPKITFYGYTSRPLEAIAKSEIFILPSYREGLSMSLLDAAMMQKIIIASDVGGSSEVILNEQTGILIRPKDSEALAKAMITVLSKKQFAQNLAKKARQKYEADFNFSLTVKKKLIPLIEQ